MLAVIENLLSSTNLDQVTRLIEDAPFEDGRLSAGSLAATAKNNHEIPAQNAVVNELNNIIMNKLVRHPQYRAICWPKKIAAPIYARYQPGMHYGPHVDDPVMGQDALYRSDISLTIFLSPKDSYEGGELRIIQPFGEQKVKLEAGSVVFYPSSSLHTVTPVINGTRYVAVSWVESSIRDAEKRHLLYELNQARELLIAQQPGSEACNKVSNSFNNLVRQWVEL